jgi:hypothetical protein
VSAQKTVFDEVKIHRHRSPEKIVLVNKLGTLTFDDSAHKLAYKSDADDHINVSYDDVEKIVFESTTRMRGGVLSYVAGFTPLAGGIARAAIAGGHVSDYWLYMSYSSGGRDESVLLVVPKHLSGKVITKATSVFGARATLVDYPEKGAAIKMEDLKALKSKQTLRVDKKNHPMPEVKADKATVLVVCPPLAARYAGRGNQFKLHANDRIVAVNRPGTYSFAYLDPGKYRLVSQTENANGFEMELEAGHEYYFLQTTFQGVFKDETALSRDSPELVTYLAEGSYFADWKPKEK